MKSQKITRPAFNELSADAIRNIITFISGANRKELRLVNSLLAQLISVNDFEMRLSIQELSILPSKITTKLINNQLFHQFEYEHLTVTNNLDQPYESNHYTVNNETVDFFTTTRTVTIHSNALNLNRAKFAKIISELTHYDERAHKLERFKACVINMILILFFSPLAVAVNVANVQYLIRNVYPKYPLLVIFPLLLSGSIVLFAIKNTINIFPKLYQEFEKIDFRNNFISQTKILRLYDTKPRRQEDAIDMSQIDSDLQTPPTADNLLQSSKKNR